MMKRMSISLLLVLFCCSLVAQEHQKTILFLIPFYSKDYTGLNVSSLRDCDDIRNIPAFRLMGFWAGAQVALDEYSKNNDAPLRVVVRDVTEDVNHLTSIMEDESLMRDVDVIIGPFFSKAFAVAARYAKQYKIPIVNPFTTRTDILKDNEYVFKLTPACDNRPAILAYIAEQFPDSQIILMSDSSATNREYDCYARYLKERGIEYIAVDNKSQLIAAMKPESRSFVVTFSNNPARMLMLSDALLYGSFSGKYVLVVPEEWLSSNTYDVGYFSRLNIHFFSDCYVDLNDEATLLFIDRYKTRFSAPPTLDNFAFQGYDVTRFFIDFVMHDKDLDRVKTVPLVYPLSFDKRPSGGYENVNVHFLEVVDNEIQPVRF